MTMERQLLVLTVLLCQHWMLPVSCDSEISPVIDRMDDFDLQLVQIKREIAQFEERVLNKMDVSKIALRSELQQDLRKRVREIMADILQGESIEDMLESQLISDVKQLQRENKEMRKMLTDALRNDDAKSEREVMEAKYCSKYIQETHALKGDLNQCVRKEAQCNNEIQRLEKQISSLNTTDMATALSNCSNSLVKMTASLGNISNNFMVNKMSLESSRRQIAERDVVIAELRKSLCLLNESCQQQTDDVYTTPESSLEVFHTTSESATTSPITTTTRPEEEKTRLLIVPLWSQTAHVFQQINLQNKSLTNYNHKDIKQVTSVVYVSKLRKLLFCLFHPNRIVSTSLDGSNITTLTEDVCAYDMAVDEDIDTVFLATCDPMYTVSRMSTEGQNYNTVVNFTEYGKLISAVAVYPGKQQIFACSENKLFMVSYDGDILHTFVTGLGALAMTLDTEGGNVYYNHLMNVMKLSLSSNTTTKVASLNVIPWNFRFFRQMVYYSTTGSSTGYIGAVNVSDGSEPTVRPLHTIKLKGSSTYSICLIP